MVPLDIPSRVSPLMHHLRIGGDDEFVQIAPYDRGGEWIHVAVTLRVHGFTGNHDAWVDPVSLLGFRVELGLFYDDPRKPSTFELTGDQLWLGLKGDGLGGMKVDGRSFVDSPNVNALEFGFRIDQTLIPSMLRQLDAMLAERNDAPVQS
jgi:hypothetical protein